MKFDIFCKEPAKLQTRNSEFDNLNLKFKAGYAWLNPYRYVHEGQFSKKEIL